MGTCNMALLSYGIIIPIPKAIALLNVLRKLPLETGRSTDSWDTDEIEDTDGWEYEYDEELGERIKNQLATAGFDWEEFELQSLGNDSQWEGLAVLFKGLYDKNEANYARGMEVEFWGREEGMTRAKRLVYKPWEDEEFMGHAKQTFKQLAELSPFKEARVEVDPDWLHAIWVS